MPVFLILSMLLAFSVPVLSSPVEARTAKARMGGGSVPNLDIESACKSIAHYDPAKPGNYENCVKEERDARKELEKSWRSVPADERQQCLYLVTPPALPSYINLQGCLNIAEGAEELAKKNEASPSGEQQPSGGEDTLSPQAARAGRLPNGGEIAKP